VINEQVNSNNKKVVVWCRCLERVPDVDSIVIVSVNDKLVKGVSDVVKHTTGHYQSFIVEDLVGVRVFRNGALEP
jgi:hypothetical protein